MSASPRVALAQAPRTASLSPASLAEVRERLMTHATDAALAEGRRQAALEAAGALDAALGRLDAAREEAAAELARTAVGLAVEIVRELLRHELDLGHYDLERIVRESLAVSGVERGKTVVVHLNPADLERLAGVAFRAGTELVPDPEVRRGDVHVTTPHGVLVRDLDRALTSIGERIRGDLA